MTKEKAVTFKVANTEITIGDIFEIKPKPDLDAPSGFVEHGTSKLLMKGIGESHGVEFDEEVGLWNTGFLPTDTVLNRAPKRERETLSETYKKYIADPYSERYQKNLSNNNDEFWNSYSYKVGNGIRFDTSNPKELFDLYNALMQGDLCEKGEKDAYLQRSAKYNVVNVLQSQNLQEEREESKFEAISVFNNLVNTLDPDEDDSLFTILEWINAGSYRTSSKDDIRKAGIKLFMNDKVGYDNARRFLEAKKLIGNKSNKELMEMFSIINKVFYLAKGNKRAIKYEGKQYFIDEMLLGNNLKEAAKNATENVELKQAILGAYEKL